MRSTDKTAGKREAVQALVWAAKRLRNGDDGITVSVWYDLSTRRTLMEIEEDLQVVTKERIGDVCINR